jgi:hypothetical protein
MSLLQSLNINGDLIRIRSFEFNGQTLKVRVPTTAEADMLYQKMKDPSPELIESKYAELSQSLLDKRSELEDGNNDIEYKNDDIILAGKSIRELAKGQAEGEVRILETFKFLVPKDGKNLDDLTYEDISKDIPFPIQLEMVKKIAEVISVSYEEARKN